MEADRQEKRKSEFGLYTAGFLLDQPQEPLVPLIEDFIYVGDTVAVVGHPEAGKSLIALEASLCLTSGTDFLDTLCVAEAGSVLYILTEGKRTSFIDRVRRMSKAVGIDRDKFMLFYQAGLDLNKESGYTYLTMCIARAIREGWGSVPKLIVIDSLYSSIEGNMNDIEVMGPFCINLRRLKDLYGCSIIVVHHEHKTKYDGKGVAIQESGGQSMSGHACFWAALEAGYIVRQLVGGKRSIQAFKDRDATMIKRMELAVVSQDPLVVCVAGDASPSYAAVKWYLEQATKPMTVEELMKSVGVSRETVNKAIRHWKNERKIVRVNVGSNPALYGIKGRKYDKETEEG